MEVKYECIYTVTAIRGLKLLPYILAVWSYPPTSTSDLPDLIHIMDYLRPSLTFTALILPCHHKQKNEKWDRPGNEATL